LSTSGSYSFTVNAAQIVNEAALNVGAIGEAEVLTSQEYSDILRKLNMMAKQWMGKQDFAPGLKMWTRTRGALFLGFTQHTYYLGPTGSNWAGGVTGGSTGQLFNQTTTTSVANVGATSIQVSSITNINANDNIGILCGNDLFWTTVAGVPSGTTVNLALPFTTQSSSNSQVYNYTTRQQRPLEIETSVLRDIYYNDTPQDVMTLQDYEILPTKTSPTYQADPSAFYYESAIGTPPSIPASANGIYKIQCGGAQDVTKYLHIVFLSPVQDFVNPGDNPAFPQQWYMALCWGLARQIAPMFDSIWDQTQENNYKESLAMAKQADAEVTSFYYQRDSGSPYEP
jgi:hypothetical protein